MCIRSELTGTVKRGQLPIKVEIQCCKSKTDNRTAAQVTAVRGVRGGGGVSGGGVSGGGGLVVVIWWW